MKVLCTYCGKSIMVSGLGRKAFNMPVIKVCDALRLHHSVLVAANELGCSRAYIYKSENEWINSKRGLRKG